MSGHEGINKTVDRVIGKFWWPGVQSDVARYCRSCDMCQRTVHRGRVTKGTSAKDEGDRHSFPASRSRLDWADNTVVELR